MHLFTLDDIKAAHAKVKTGADFPNYIKTLKQLGVKKYDSFVSDGHSIFFGAENHQVISGPKYKALPIAESSNSLQFKVYLQSHQQGQTDYPGFCRHAAETGVDKWTVDLDRMTCTYYDKTNTCMLVEQIPAT